MIRLTELEQDVLKEIFNVGMGRAAKSLSLLVDEEVLLTIPYLAFVEPDKAAAMIQERTRDQVSGVRQHFGGPFSGEALLIYPEEKSLELVRSILREEAPPVAVLTELERESLMEVGNVILNACLGNFANFLELELECGLPEFVRGQCRNLLAAYAPPTSPDQPEEAVLLMIVDFTTGRSAIKGYVILLLDARALVNLQSELQTLLTRFNG